MRFSLFEIILYRISKLTVLFK